jgi:protein-tyrosine phosphatase
MEDAGIVRLAEEREGGAGGLATRYRHTLETVGPAFAQAVRLTGAAKGPTLIHCTAGKDRTGLVVAVLLAALGVARAEIVEDYLQTERNMPGVLARIETAPELEDGRALVERIASTQPEIFTAPPAAISAALDVLDRAGGVDAWLALHGVSDAELQRLRERLLEDSQQRS